MTRIWACGVLAAAAALAMNSTPAHAARALQPGEKQVAYSHWTYPSQISYGGFEDGNGQEGRSQSPNAFLTLPFMGPHYVTSIFDHCAPTNTVDGKVCRYDGVSATTANGPDPNFTAGYARTPQGSDFLYYDGHNGYDYGLNYEPVAAAASGTVSYSDWWDNSCHTCSSGKTILINHGNGFQTLYGHVSVLLVSKGQYVRRGQVIAISGMTGSATGPHLHFGVYLSSGRGPVDPFGWSGSGPDPWPIDEGDLWLGGSPRFAPIAMPSVSVAASQDAKDPTLVHVSWSSPGEGNSFDVSVRQGDELTPLLNNQPAGSLDFRGKPGRVYFFWVSVTTDFGWTDGAASDVIRIAVPVTPTYG